MEIVGDVRAIFTPQDFDIDQFPDLHPLVPEGEKELLLYQEVRLSHMVEHVHWYNQPAMWTWLYKLLDHGGWLDITTPDMEYVIKTYWRNKSRWWRFLRRNKVRYPIGEHQDIADNTDEHLSRWVCFRFHSGGSFNKDAQLHDFHLGLYDRDRLEAELKAAGFRDPTVRRRGGELHAIARKAKLKQTDYYTGRN